MGEHEVKLESIDFIWQALNESRDDMFDRLVKYKLEYGHKKVPQRYKNDPKLGTWVKNQRLRRQSLSTARVKRLDNICFSWKFSSGSAQQHADARVSQCISSKQGIAELFVSGTDGEVSNMPFRLAHMNGSSSYTGQVGKSTLCLDLGNQRRTIMTRHNQPVRACAHAPFAQLNVKANTYQRTKGHACLSATVPPTSISVSCDVKTSGTN